VYLSGQFYPPGIALKIQRHKKYHKMKNPFIHSSELFTFFELTPDLVCIAGKDGFLKQVNPAVVHKLGYTEAELYTKPIESFIHPEDKAMTASNRERLLAGKALLNFINRYVTKTGEVVWLEWTSIYVSEKEIVFAIAKDVTERKILEEKANDKYKKFKSLATHFKNSIEKDRKHLAYELHEELAQLVAAVKMDIDMLAHSMENVAGTQKATLEHAVAVSGLLIKSIQRISFSISPQMLEDFGLNATIEWLCKEFSILNGIHCSFENAYDESSLTQEIKTDFFRICQEALLNVADYAEAANVKVSIKERGDHITLSVIDDGKGFDMNEVKIKHGLVNMKERAASINGQLTIQSKPGEGTSILVDIARHWQEEHL